MAASGRGAGGDSTDHAPDGDLHRSSDGAGDQRSNRWWWLVWGGFAMAATLLWALIGGGGPAGLGWQNQPDPFVLGAAQARRYTILMEDLRRLEEALERLHKHPDQPEAVAALDNVLPRLDDSVAELGGLVGHQHELLGARLQAALRALTERGRTLVSATSAIGLDDLWSLHREADAAVAIATRLFLSTNEGFLRTITADRRKLERATLVAATLLATLVVACGGLAVLVLRTRRAQQVASAARQRLDDAIEAITDGFVLWDARDRLVLCNRRYREMYPSMGGLLRPGAHFEPLMRHFVRSGGLGDASQDEDGWLAERLRERELAGGEPFERRVADGRWMRIANQRTADGGLVAIHTDITYIKAREHALRDSEERFRVLTTSSPVGIGRLTPDHRILYANPSFCRLLEVSLPEQLTGHDWGEFVAEEDRALALRHRRRRDHGISSTYELRVVGRAGGRRHVLFTGTPLPEADGALSGILVTLQDISERKAAERRVHHLAHHDPLSGLPNRALFGDRLDRALRDTARHGDGFAVLALDLDSFKSVNDSFGHAIGDALLRTVASRLLRALRAVDTVARLSGDEFAVILPQVTDPADAEQVATKIVRLLGEPYELEGHTLHLGASVGIALHPEHGTTADQLLRCADLALYRAKEGGGGGHTLFEATMSERASWRKRLETDLRSALEEGAFRLAYQPQIELASGAVVGAEALLRWEHPERGGVGPTEFIPVAEACGLVIPLGQWVLETACRQLRTWREQGLPRVRLSINLSPVQIRRPGLFDMVVTTLAANGFEPGWLELEITESILMDDAAGVRQTLERLRRFGISLSLDDFGTGFSSLGYLKRFPVDRIKIDRSFVADIGRTAADDALVTAMVALAHSLGVEVVAEGIETESQLAFLGRCRCDLVQGFHLGRPLTPERFAERLVAKPDATKQGLLAAT